MKARKILSAIIAIAIIATLTVSVSAADGVTVDDSGTISVYDGVSIDTSWYNTTDTEFTINSAAAFAGFAAIANGTADGIAADTFEGKTIKLGTNIDLDNQPWAPIGGRTSPTLSGQIECTFDGQGYTISNLKVEKGSEYEAINMNIGLFGITRTGKFVAKNFTLENVDIYGSASVAAVLGRTVNCGAKIDNVDVIGDIKIEASTQNVGAICAQGYTPIITNCGVVGNAGSYIKAGTQVGGIVGWSGESSNVTTIKNCSVENVTISGEAYVGAVAAIIQYGATVKDNIVKNVSLNGITDAYHYGTIIGSMGAGYITNAGAFTAPVCFSGNTAETVTVTLNGEAVAVPVEIGAHYDSTSFVTVKIGDAYYESLQIAVNAAQDGDTITLLSNVEMEKVTAVTDFDGVVATSIKDLVTALYIPAGKSIVLDLNGKRLSGYATNASIGSGFVAPDVYKNYAMIVNDGTLTIKDSLSGGKISYTDLNSDVNNYYSLSTTILNGGTLIMESGRVENLSEGSSVCPAIDNSSFWSNPALKSPVLTINGGELYSKNYFAVRAYTHYEDAADNLTNNLIVNDGKIGGRGGIYGQVGDLWATRDVTLKLTINDGDIYAEGDYPAFRIFLANPDNTGLGLVINGGNFTGAIRADVNFGYGNTTGGSTANGSANSYWLEKNGGFITGGTFSNIGSADDVMTNLASFLADGYTLTKNSNGTYGVAEETKTDIFGEQNAYINDITYEQDDADFYSVILLAGIDSLNYREVGFKVTVDGTTKEQGTNTVYTSILASDASGEEITVKPDDFGTKVGYIFGQRYEFDGKFKTSALTFCPYAIDTNGNYIYGEEATIEKIYSK